MLRYSQRELNELCHLNVRLKMFFTLSTFFAFIAHDFLLLLSRKTDTWRYAPTFSMEIHFYLIGRILNSYVSLNATFVALFFVQRIFIFQTIAWQAFLTFSNAVMNYSFAIPTHAGNSESLKLSAPGHSEIFNKLLIFRKRRNKNFAEKIDSLRRTSICIEFSTYSRIFLASLGFLRADLIVFAFHIFPLFAVLTEQCKNTWLILKKKKKKKLHNSYSYFPTLDVCSCLLKLPLKWFFSHLSEFSAQEKRICLFFFICFSLNSLKRISVCVCMVC